MRRSNIFKWTLRIVAASILLQTLLFKFTASPESVFIFSKLGIEPAGRIGSGIVELIASVLILIPRFTIWGAILALGVMAGAIMSHLTVLGIDVQGDGGLLFFLAITTFICCSLLIFTERQRLILIIHPK